MLKDLLTYQQISLVLSDHVILLIPATNPENCKQETRNNSYYCRPAMVSFPEESKKNND